MRQPQARGAWGHQQLEEAGILQQGLRRECVLLTPDFGSTVSKAERE